MQLRSSKVGIMRDFFPVLCRGRLHTYSEGEQGGWGAEIHGMDGWSASARLACLR